MFFSLMAKFLPAHEARRAGDFARRQAKRCASHKLKAFTPEKMIRRSGNIAERAPLQVVRVVSATRQSAIRINGLAQAQENRDSCASQFDQVIRV